MLVDIIQKCVIISASLSDLYGGASMMQSNRDISIQPFATSSILQHHYQSTIGSPGDFASSAASANNGAGPDNGSGGISRGAETEQQTAKMKADNENGISNNNGAFHKSTPKSSNESTAANQVSLSRLAIHHRFLKPPLSPPPPMLPQPNHHHPTMRNKLIRMPYHH